MSEFDQQAVNYVILFAFSLGGFVFKSIWDTIKELQQTDAKITEKLSEVEVLVAGDYVKKDEFVSVSNTIFSKLDKIAEQQIEMIKDKNHA